MVARAEMLGDTGSNYPDTWVGGLARPDLHAIVVLFAREATERGRSQAEHDKLVARCDGVEVLSPSSLRESVASAVSNAAALYGAPANRRDG